jgi:hypothetical protein
LRYPVHGCFQTWFSHAQGSCYVTFAIPLVNLTNTVLKRHRLAIRADCHVAKYKSVVRDRLFRLELSKQLSLKTTHPRFKYCTRMMSYQASNTVSNTDPAEKAGTVQRVETRVGHIRPVPNVMQPGCCYQSTISQSEGFGNIRRLASHALDMLPSAWQGASQEPPCQS